MVNVKNLKRSSLYFLIIGLLVSSVFLFFFSFFSDPNEILDEQTVPLKLIIGDHFGFDVSKEELNFGMINKGANAYREDLIIKNNYDFPIELEFIVEGNITGFLFYNKTIYIESGEEASVKISTITISNETEGNYSGSLNVLFRRAP